MIPETASQVFMELTLGSVVMGYVLIKLDTQLPNMVQIFTGQNGFSLKDFQSSVKNTMTEIFSIRI